MDERDEKALAEYLATPEGRSEAAAAMGRLGGRKKSAKKTAAARINGLRGGKPHNLRGGRPKKVQP
jgi:hypothetical protein